jgi:hypothetical protein
MQLANVFGNVHKPSWPSTATTHLISILTYHPGIYRTTLLFVDNPVRVVARPE